MPLLERVRFLSISASNLDEFYSVRVAGLRGLVREGVHTPRADGLSPAEQLRRIDADARALMMRQQECLGVLARADARRRASTSCGPATSRAPTSRLMETHFFEQVFPILSPLAIDPAHPFPFIANGGFAMGLQLRREADDTVLEALLPVPGQVPRFVRLPDGPKGAGPLPAARGAARGLPRQALPRLRHARPLRLPGAARQRPRGRGGGRGPGPRVRDRAEAPAPRRGDPAHHDRRRAGRPAPHDRRRRSASPTTR